MLDKFDIFMLIYTSAIRWNEVDCLLPNVGRCVKFNFLINPVVVNKAVNLLSVKQHANFANVFSKTPSKP
jgi:hypothetical protein